MYNKKYNTELNAININNYRQIKVNPSLIPLPPLAFPTVIQNHGRLLNICSIGSNVSKGF